MSNYKATSEQWKKVEESAAPSAVVTGGSTDSCILELRARAEAIEAMPPVAGCWPVAVGLVERVATVLHEQLNSDLPVGEWELEARAAILEVARWLRKQGAECSADLLEQEAGR
jgi:hypothetical protein